MWRAYLEDDLKSAVAALERAMELVPFHKRDPEARFILAEESCDVKRAGPGFGTPVSSVG